MSLNFDPNASSFGPVTGPSYVPPATPTGDETDTHDPTSSTISQSLAEALMVQYLMGWPVLEQPNDNGTYTTSVEGITAMVGAEFARIGSDMWDNYLDHLAEQKQRIIDYLNSPQFRDFIQDRTLRGAVQNELNSNINTQNPIYNATDFNTYINSQIIAATELWTNTIDGVSNYIQQNRESNPEAGIFIAASFAVTATYIGDYLNIVDIASTDMVTVNPVQDAVAQVLPLIPQQLQDQFTMVINLFAIGLINFSNAEAILRSSNQQRPPENWDTAVAFAHSVLANVQGNIVNGFLLAMLITKSENMSGTQEERNAEINKLTTMAKAIMVAFAIGGLLKASAPDMPLTAALFFATINKPLVAQSEIDKRLVDELSPLVEYLNNLRANDLLLSGSDWENLLEALGHFFQDDPDFEDVFRPTNLAGSLGQNLFNPDIEG
jgi:hypothetical protein